MVRTYPDRGHGSLTLLGPPPRTPLISFPLLAGRWLRDGDDDEVVLNHSAAAPAGGARPGAALLLSAEGRVRPVRVVGVVEESAPPGVVYMNRDAFSAQFAAPRMARAKTESSSLTEREAAIRRIEQALGHAGASGAHSLSRSDARRLRIG